MSPPDSHPTRDAVSADVTSPERTHPSREQHMALLALSVGVLVAAFLFDVLPDQRIAFRFLPQRPLPHVCLSRVLFDAGCPACGLTRSFIHLAHGDWRESLAVHRLGWLFAAFVALQIPYRLFALKSSRSPLPSQAANAVMWTLCGLLVANWLVGFAL